MNDIPGSFIGNDRFECGQIDACAQAHEGNENACESLCETVIFVLPLDQVAIPFVSATQRSIWYVPRSDNQADPNHRY